MDLEVLESSEWIPVEGALMGRSHSTRVLSNCSGQLLASCIFTIPPSCRCLAKICSLPRYRFLVVKCEGMLRCSYSNSCGLLPKMLL